MSAETCDAMSDNYVSMEMPHFVQSQSAAAATAMMHHPTSSHPRCYKRPADHSKASLPPIQNKTIRIHADCFRTSARIQNPAGASP
jgi:hypothetical protein